MRGEARVPGVVGVVDGEGVGGVEGGEFVGGG